MTHHLWHSAWNPEGLPNKDMPAPSARISYTKEEIETFFSFFDILTLLVRETADAPEGVGSASGSMHLQERPQVYLKNLATNQKVSLYWEQQVRAPKLHEQVGKAKQNSKKSSFEGCVATTKLAVELVLPWQCQVNCTTGVSSRYLHTGFQPTIPATATQSMKYRLPHESWGESAATRLRSIAEEPP